MAFKKRPELFHQDLPDGVRLTRRPFGFRPAKTMPIANARALSSTPSD
jgi:hypothetical protein